MCGFLYEKLVVRRSYLWDPNDRVQALDRLEYSGRRAIVVPPVLAGPPGTPRAPGPKLRSLAICLELGGTYT